MKGVSPPILAARLAPLLLGSALLACGGEPVSSLPGTEPSLGSYVPPASEAPPPAGLAAVTVGGRTLALGPYTMDNFTDRVADPVNLVFFGMRDRADPRAIRAALRGLDGDRTAYGLPNAYPFDCTWSDAIGETQAIYGDREAWTGSAIQLECGHYGNDPARPFRFHLRLFPQELFTVGGAHFEFLLPGTTQHQVLSWELAEALVTVDMMRAGILGGAPMPTGPINQAPTYRDILAPVYNALPAAIRALIGLPGPNVTANVPIPSDGRGTAFVVEKQAPIVPDVDEEEIVVTWQFAIPKPFCSSGPADFVLVQGPITLHNIARVLPSGVYERSFRTEGTLTLTPWNPVTGTPAGAPYSARIVERYAARDDGRSSWATTLQRQREMPATGPFRGSLFKRFEIGNGGFRDRFVEEIACDD